MVAIRHTTFPTIHRLRAGSERRRPVRAAPANGDPRFDDIVTIIPIEHDHSTKFPAPRPHDPGTPAPARGELPASTRGQLLRRAAALHDLALPPDARWLMIDVFGPIGSRTADGRGITALEVEAAIAANPQVRSIIVRIDSNGGSVAQSERMHDALRGAGKHVTCRVVGQCASAAIDVLLAGDYREACPNARFLIHSAATVDAGERRTAAWHEAAAAHCAELDSRLAKRLCARCGNFPKFWQRLIETEIEITADEALHRYLLIDSITAAR